jgi:hypothetical protein
MNFSGMWRTGIAIIERLSLACIWLVAALMLTSAAALAQPNGGGFGPGPPPGGGMAVDGSTATPAALGNIAARAYGTVPSGSIATGRYLGYDGVGGLVTGTGGGTGSNYPPSAITEVTNYSLQTADSGTCFDNNGASGPIILTLPTKSAGLAYCANVVAAQTVEVAASSGASIAVGGVVGASGGNVQTNVAGSTLLIYAPNGSGPWEVQSSHGTWQLN